VPTTAGVARPYVLNEVKVPRPSKPIQGTFQPPTTSKPRDIKIEIKETLSTYSRPLSQAERRKIPKSRKDMRRI